MPRPRRGIKKEDIGDPSNFRHVEGYGRSVASALKPPQDTGSDQGKKIGLKSQVSFEQDETFQDEFKVERRNKGRSSLIPRHHRSTTTCIFPPESGKNGSSRDNGPSLKNRQNSVESPDIKSSLGKPAFGSLLNLSFLPLGLGKSSSKSPSIGKTKRTSLLNLTAAGLFSNQKSDEKRESVHMTSYIRRRSSSNEENDDNPPASSAKPCKDNGNTTVSVQTLPKKPIAARPMLAKLGRSKSSMSEFTKRPKLRLVMPPSSPPPVPPLETFTKRFEPDLPSPPPSPLPSPPPSPEPVVLRPSPKSLPRPRIIPLPSASSVDSLGPGSPQYLTPAGGSSPQPDPVFPVLSPTLPPSSTPFFSLDNLATPPIWPLQPQWPTQVPMQKKTLEATIPELPSPCKEEMETENEYIPVMSIVDSFITNGPEKLTSANIPAISSVLHENISFDQMLRLSDKMFRSLSTESSLTPCQKEIYKSIWARMLEFWVASFGDDAAADKLIDTLREENHHQATDALLGILKDLQM